MDLKEIAIEKNETDLELSDLAVPKFRVLAKEYFQIDVLEKPDYSKLLAASRTFYSFSLPSELSEEFIVYEYAPLFWSFDSPFILYIENYLKKTLSQIGGQSFYKKVKDFYLKWLTIKSEEEKKYFATSTINFIEHKSNKKNFLHLIYYSMVLAYDASLFNPEKSIVLLDESLEIVNNNSLNNDVKEELKYLINLYKGFVYLKQDNLENAFNSFSDSLAIKPNGINVKFFKLYSAFLLKKESFPIEVLTDITNYDIMRIEFAIENNDMEMLDYFINYATITNIFYYSEIFQSHQSFSDFLFDLKGSTEFEISTIKKNINNFNNLNITDYYDDNIKNNIAFIENFLKKYSNNKNILIIGALNKLHQKFVDTMELIIKAIKDKYEFEIRSKLNHYDKQIQNKQDELKQMERNHEEYKVRMKKKFQDKIIDIENNAKINIAAVEQKIENIHLIKKFNPNYSFKNAMTYNIILSSTISLMGGCAGYSNNFMVDYNKFSDFIFIVLVSGLKWGIMAFSIGLIFATIYAGITLLEGANQKQKLLQLINKIKAEKESYINYCRKEEKENEELSEERFKKNSESIKKYIESLAAEKESQEKKYRKQIDQQLKNEAQVILELI